MNWNLERSKKNSKELRNYNNKQSGNFFYFFFLKNISLVPFGFVDLVNKKKHFPPLRMWYILYLYIWEEKREIDFPLFVVPLTDEQKSQARGRSLVWRDSCLMLLRLWSFESIFKSYLHTLWSYTVYIVDFHMYVIIQVPMLTQIFLYPYKINVKLWRAMSDIYINTQQQQHNNNADIL